MQMMFSQRFSQISMKKIAAITSPKKLDVNQLYFKRAIDLFYQINPIQEFVPAEQFQRVQSIPVTREQFCELVSEVVFKKTKKFIASVLSLAKHNNSQAKQITVDQLPAHLQNSWNEVKFLINQQKILLQMLRRIRRACTRLQKLIFKMIDLHKWKCQSKSNCSQAYIELDIVRTIYEKCIVTNQTIRKYIRTILHQYLVLNHVNIQELNNQICIWGSDDLLLILDKYQKSLNLGHVASVGTKYFICRECRFDDHEDLKPAIQGKKKKKKNKKKKSKKENIDGQSQTQQIPNRKGSLLEIQEHSTCLSEEADGQVKSEQGNFQRVQNFLQDLKIDPQNRLEMRLPSQADVGDLDTQDQNSKLMKKINKILRRY